MTDFAQKLKGKNAEDPGIYFTLLDAADITLSLVLNPVRGKKRERQRGLWVLFKIYSGGAAYGFAKFGKASKIPISKVRQFLHSKTWYTSFSQPTRKLRKLEVIARFRNEIWCLGLAFVDKLARDNNGVEDLHVRQDMFDGTMDARGMKTKVSNETLKTFSKMTTRRNRPKELWVDQGEFENFCAAEVCI